MYKIFALTLIMAISFNATAQETFTRTLPNGDTQVVLPVTERQCQEYSKANYGNAVVGAGVGAAAGEVADRAISSGSRGSRVSSGALVGAAIGAIVGINTQNEKACRWVDVTTGYRVITFSKSSGKSTEVIIPKKK